MFQYNAGKTCPPGEHALFLLFAVRAGSFYRAAVSTVRLLKQTATAADKPFFFKKGLRLLLFCAQRTGQKVSVDIVD